MNKLLEILLCAFLILTLPLWFVFFTAWELMDKKASQAFWDDVCDPYS